MFVSYRRQLFIYALSMFRLQEDPPAGVSGAPTDNNIMLWNAVIFGYVYISCSEIMQLPFQCILDLLNAGHRSVYI